MRKLYKVYNVRVSEDNYIMEPVTFSKYYDVAINDAAFLSLTNPGSLYCVLEYDLSTGEVKVCETFLR